MPQPTPQAQNIQGPLRLEQYLTTFSQNYILDRRHFLTTRAASLINVAYQNDQYLTYDRGYFWRDEVEPRPLGGRPIQVGYKVTPASYAAVEYAAEHFVDDRQRTNAAFPLELDETAATILVQKHLIHQERIWVQKFFQTGQWSTEYQGVDSSPGTDQFLQFNDAFSDPIGVIDAAKDRMLEQTGYRPNTLVLGPNVRRALRTHPDIADRIKYTQTGIADDDILSALFEVPRVLTAYGNFNAAPEGAPDDIQWIANPNDMWLGYINPTPSLNSVTAIATFAWTGLLPGFNAAMGLVITRGRDDRAYTDYFHCRAAWDQRKVSDDLGIFFNDVVAG